MGSTLQGGLQEELAYGGWLRGAPRHGSPDLAGCGRACALALRQVSQGCLRIVHLLPKEQLIQSAHLRQLRGVGGRDCVGGLRSPPTTEVKFAAAAALRVQSGWDGARR